MYLQKLIRNLRIKGKRNNCSKNQVKQANNRSESINAVELRNFGVFQLKSEKLITRVDSPGRHYNIEYLPKLSALISSGWLVCAGTASQ